MICSVCKQEKPKCDFYFRKDAKKYRLACIECFNAARKQYRRDNQKQILTAKKLYRTKHKTTLNDKAKSYFQKNKTQINDRRKNNAKVKAAKQRHYQKHKEEILLKQKQYRDANKDKIKQRNSRNKEARSVVAAKRHKQRKQTDINYRLACCLRGRLNIALKSKQKTGSAVKDLGCSIDFLKMHLSALFYDSENNEMMAWDNYGEWEIDHIMPLHTFDLSNREEFLKAANYTNLQPLWKKDHIAKHKKEMEKL